MKKRLAFLKKSEESDLQKLKDAKAEIKTPKIPKPKPWVTLLTAVVLTGILSSTVTYGALNTKQTESTPIVTLKGDTIDIIDFYNETKKTQLSSAKASVLLSIMSRVLESEYGDKVTEEDVQKLYDENASGYGDTFEDEIAKYGYTTDTYKESLRLDLLMDAAYQKVAEAEITDEDIQTQYDQYFPKVNAQVLVFDSETNAKTAKDQLAEKDFATIAQEIGQEKVDYEFTSESTDLPATIMEDAWKLDVDSVSDIITYDDAATATTYYFVIKTTAKETKGSLDELKDKMKEMAIEYKKEGAEFQQKVLSDLFKKYNVKIKDEAFGDVLFEYTGVE